MELQKNTLPCQRRIALETVYREESADCIVPDSQPDVDRILDVRAIALVRDREAQPNEVKLRCTIRVQVLYAAENDEKIYALETPVSFTHTIPARGVEPRDEIVAEARTAAADARVLNSRKIALRTTTALRVRVYREDEEQIACGAAEPGLCVRTQARTLRCTAAVGVRNFTLAEDLELDAGMPSALSVLGASFSIEALEAKILAGRASVRAQGTAHALYRDADGMPQTLEKSFTFTQSADVAAAGDDLEARVRFTLRSFELECAVDMSGESRFLSLSAGVTMYVEAARSLDMQILEDMYGLKREIAFTCRELSLQPPAEPVHVRAAVSEKLETAQSVGQIVCARACPDLAAERADGETLSSAAVLWVLYRGTDGMLYGVSRRVELRFSDAGADADTAVVSAGTVTAAAAGDGLQVDFDAYLDGEKCGKEKIRVIEDAQWGEAYEEDERALSAILMRVPGEESVWEIAKRFHTTSAAIEAGNPGVDLYAPGALILIPL